MIVQNAGEIAAIAAENVLGNADFIRRLVKGEPSTAEWILDKIVEIKNALTGKGDAANREIAFLRRAEKLYLDAIAELGGTYRDGKIYLPHDEEDDELTRKNAENVQVSDTEGGENATQAASGENKKSPAEGEDVKYSRGAGEKNKEAASFSKGTISVALWDAFDHKDSGDDNLIRVSKMPRYVTEKFGIEGDFYIYRDHAYENMVSEEDARFAGRPVKRKGRDIHFHNLGVEKMTDALLSIEHPVMTIDDTRKEGNPQVVMMLDVQGNNNAPLYAVLSFYSNQPINGRFERKPHIVLTVAEKSYLEQDGYGSWEETVRKAVEDGRVLDFNKNKRTDLSVIAQRTSLGNITEGSLKESISRFLKKINTFKQKNKISYSRKAPTDGQAAKDHADRNYGKIYTKKDAREIISAALTEHLTFPDDGVFGNLVGKSRDQAIEVLWKGLNSAEEGKRAGLALDMADFIIENAVAEDLYDDGDNTEQLERLKILRGYMHKLDLAPIKGEIEYKLGKKNTAALVWGARKGQRGLDVDVAAMELAERGITKI